LTQLELASHSPADGDTKEPTGGGRAATSQPATGGPEQSAARVGRGDADDSGSQASQGPTGRGVGGRFGHERGAVVDGVPVQRGLGTIRYPKASVTMSGKLPVSRMREGRMYGLKGGWGNGPAMAPRP